MAGEEGGEMEDGKGDKCAVQCSADLGSDNCSVGLWAILRE